MWLNAGDFEDAVVNMTINAMHAIENKGCFTIETRNVLLEGEEADIFDLLKKLNEKSTIIVVSHDIGFISGYVNRVACLNQTLICHETAAISGKTIEELYGGSVHMIQHAHSHSH